MAGVIEQSITDIEHNTGLKSEKNKVKCLRFERQSHIDIGGMILPF
jgi:hypothetical protein